MSAVLCSLALGGVGALLGVTPAHAETGVSIKDGQLTVLTSSGKNNNITVRLTGSTGEEKRLTISDATDRLIEAHPDCYLYTKTVMTCWVHYTTQVYVMAGDGNDTVQVNDGSRTARVFGGPGNDRLIATPSKTRGGDPDRGNDLLSGGDGDDVLLGGDGNNDLHGGKGRDELRGGKGNDQLRGDQDNDMIFGDAGDDFLLGASGDDALTGGFGSDRAWGDQGNDRLIMKDDGPSNDVANGGVDRDLCTTDVGDTRIDCES